MMSKQQKHQIDVYLNALGGLGASQINDFLNTIATNADRLPASAERTTILDETLKAHSVNNFDGKLLADFQAWNNAQPTEEPTVPVDPPPVDPPPTNPPPTMQLVDPIPNDSVTRKFGPITMGQVYTSHAGGDGMFSFSTPSGNSQYKAWVNGKIVIDGGMTEVPVKAGDQIDMAVKNQNQDHITYSINKR